MWLPHIYTDSSGQSVLDEVELKMSGPGGAAAQDGVYFQRVNAAQQDVSHWAIGHALPGHFVDFAPTPETTLVAVFSGQMHLTASNGEERQLTRGDLMLLQDAGGPGHMTRFIGQEPCNYLLIAMPDGFKQP
jgi:uncharacterized cupin superfamily protein